ncbi:serine/threonine-protein kinase [Streptomyces sp. MP131-18]|uniref:serine/threonine-protein kinase n=1 Tax=Streptomyces sp. MP131-18 TaxID=1857892 RepID=UPI00097C2382|nr:serine/threonine-protein kinase [Streptomyces sp. MP131-18]ONK14485.1 Serine/threonine-protein kinase PknB [Streptomyces sp. MP131-18]
MRVIADRYELVAFVGRGGMGEVWEGRDRVIGRRVAVKLLPDHQHGPAADLFFREARTAGGLNHRGVVTVHDLGRDQHDGTLYLIMEYVAGRNLAVVLREDGPPSPAMSVEWAAQTAAALAAAHDAGVVHRDLKPANLMLTTGGEVKILDFGIARFMAATDKSSQVMGTLAYMAPERFAEHSGDARSDLYAIGCILHELLTGDVPFNAGDPVSLMTAHLNKVPESPSSLRAGLPAALDDLVLRLLAKQPADRPRSAASVHDELRALDLAKPAPARPPAAPAATPTAPVTSPAPDDPPPYVPSSPGQPPAIHQLPTQEATPFVLGGPPAPPAPNGPPPAPGRRRALLLGLGGVAVAAGGGGLALALATGGDEERAGGTGSGTDAPPQPKVRPWRHEVANELPTVCTVADGVLYAAVGFTVTALDARTGEKRWDGPEFSFYPDQPVVADGTVYVSGGDELWALDGDGKKKWTFPTGDRVISRPAVAGGIVYFASPDKHVYAVHADGGREAWNHPLGDEIYCNPTVSDGTVYIGCDGNDNTLYALDAASGAKKWAFGAEQGFTQTPVVSGGLVYAAGVDGSLYALHADTGARKSPFPLEETLKGQNLYLAGDTLYVCSLGGRVHAFDPSTGAEKWNHGGILSPTQFTVAGDLVYVGDTLSTVGTVHALDADDGSERWSAPTLASLSSGNRDNGPVTAYDFVYIADENGVVALDAATGAAPD